MKNLKNSFFILFGCIFSFQLFSQNELKPLFDKSLFEIKPIETPSIDFKKPDLYINKLKLKTDFDFFEPYIQKGMKIVDFNKIPINTSGTSRQVFLIKHPSGKTFVVINQVPGHPYDKIINHPSGGTVITFDFNKMIYYALHPRAKGRKKRTTLKRVQICNHAYATE